MSLLNSLQFLISSQMGRFGRVNIYEKDIKLAEETTVAEVYEPEKRIRGTILFVHGMALLGNCDPRQMDVCRALARCGFRVVSPDFPEIRNVTVSYNTVENIVAAILNITADSELCPAHRIGLFAPSFSGSLGLIAASRKETAGYISSICTVGPFADLDALVQFLFRQSGCDPFAKMVIQYNFLPGTLEDSENISSAVFTAIEDDWYKREHPQLPEKLNTLNPRERELFDRLFNDPEFALENALKIADVYKDLKQAINVVSHVDYMQAPVFLVHGKDDDVIPPSESVKLAEVLREKTDVKLLITPFISHGDSSVKVNMLPELIELIRGFAFFFKYARQN